MNNEHQTNSSGALEIPNSEQIADCTSLDRLKLWHESLSHEIKSLEALLSLQDDKNTREYDLVFDLIKKQRFARWEVYSKLQYVKIRTKEVRSNAILKRTEAVAHWYRCRLIEQLGKQTVDELFEAFRKTKGYNKFFTQEQLDEMSTLRNLKSRTKSKLKRQQLRETN